MASNFYSVETMDGKTILYKRENIQGRKPSGLGEIKKYRLYESDERKLKILKSKLGYLYNENEIVREAVKNYLCNSIPLELLIP
jgi:hypothetical protein